ncbi:recombinase family protein [Nocardia sp. NPDC051463]|uniref:recombinase family protein n=1 Tax=Nocardia sp. NPDC051463 TaxID=3154845 RepID=UPI00342BFB07
MSKAVRDRGVDLMALDQGIDTSTAVGRIFFQILGAIAEFEHVLMSERRATAWPQPAPADVPVTRNPNSAPGRSNWTGTPIRAHKCGRFGLTARGTGVSRLRTETCRGRWR